jgi:hypothetical protein
VRGIAAAILVAHAACGRGRHAAQAPPSSAIDEAADAAPAPDTLPHEPIAPATAALQSTPPIVPLAIPDFPEAVVSVPIGATSPRPIVVATHGMWDLPEGLCDNWRWIVRDRAWVLCPRGDEMPDKTFRYKSGPALARELDAGVKALAARYPGYVDEGPMLYTGFSLGAILGVWIITHDPERYPRAVLTEGGEDRFSPAAASKYAKGGGRRVLFACGLKGRVAAATQAARTLERAGVDARVVLGKLPEKGEFIHWYNGPVAEETKAQLEWLLEGDARWR